MKINTPEQNPLGKVEWINPNILTSNDYNPNHVFSPEMNLLKISLLASGWTQPIVRRSDNVIVDGFHRWTLASTDKEVAALGGGLVPVVTIPISDEDKSEAKMATIRHNRARGKHSVLIVSDIVKSLQEDGFTDEEIKIKLGMEQEELNRLSSVTTSPEDAGANTFGKSWVPDK